MRTVQTIRKNKKSLTSFGRSVRAGLVITLAFLATACGSSGNKNLRNYAGKMKTPEYYKDFTDYENPKQTQPSAEAAEDNHDEFPPETYEPDSTTPDSETPSTNTPSTTTPSPVTPSTVTPSADTPTPPVSVSSPSDGKPSGPLHDSKQGPQTKPAPSTEISVGPATPQLPAPVAVTPKAPARPSIEISGATPASPPTPITPTRTPRERRRPAPTAPSADNSGQADSPKSGDCRVTAKPCFPIAGNASFSNDFGARRSGGRRHAGNDIFAEKLTPVVAIEDGIVDRADRSASEGGPNAGRLSGNYIGINHGNGVRTLYIHLNNDSPGTNDGRGHGLMPNIQVGVHVKKGQIIGWVGNSGNAETTRSHLHFEMRVTNDKLAVKAGHKAAYFPTNPYSLLKDSEGNKLSYPMAFHY